MDNIFHYRFTSMLVYWFPG